VKKTVAISCAFIVIAGCSTPAPRFTQVKIEGPAPFVMVDQKTGQLCWAGQETANGGKVTITTSKGQQTEMPVCGDVVKGLTK
jgi:hypothetical protein